MAEEKDGFRPPLSQRRRFLATLTKALLACGLVSSGAVSLLFLLPGKARKKAAQQVAVCDEDELPGRGVKKVEFSLAAAPGRRPVSHRVFLVKKQERFFALSARCTHLGCLVEWSRHRQRFVCPCHGGMYDDEGRVAQGPPPIPLARIPVFVREGKVYLEIDGQPA